MSAEPNQPPNPHAPEGQAPAPAPVAVATPAQPAGDDSAALKAQLDSLLRWKAEAEADLKKGREAKKAAEDKAAAEKKAAEDKARELGDFAKLHDAEKERRLALEAQLAELTPDAQLARDLKKRKQEAVEAAKADTSLPAYIKRAIEAARDPISAAEILDEFRASQTQPASKQPAPPAPSLAGAPPSPAMPVGQIRSVADLQNLQATDPAKFNAIVRGGPSQNIVQRVGARLTGVGRK
jgi:hypothetical protein